MITLSSPYGPIEIWACGDPAVIQRLEMDATMNAFRPAVQQHAALVGIAALPDGCLSFARLAHRLIGYCTVHPPDPIERWSQSRVPGVFELGAVETSSTHRGRHLARRLLEATFSTGRFENKIVLATLYHWHFDLEGTSLTTYAYRQLLERLYGSVGFRVFPTDDPEIAYYPGNSLMARVGPQASPELITEFERLRFLGKEALR
jgi:acetoin utilization protein AcuA